MHKLGQSVLLAAFTFAACALGAAVAQPADAAHTAVVRIAGSSQFKTAVATLDAQYDRFVAELVQLTEIPAPPFKEAERAKTYAAMFKALGLKDVNIDAEGNVLGLRPGSDPKAPLVVMAAHLDTVFPAGTPVQVRREGTKLHAPGVGDDTRGLSTLLAWIRALDAAHITTRHSILFVGDVGEEGAGDLRGVRYLFTKGAYKDRIGAFFSVDGSNPAHIVNVAVGSQRYHVTFHGPGGHSYGAFGIVNPMAAMSKAVTDLYAIKVSTEPKVTYSASVTGGGTSVNAIPRDVWMDFDMRSADPGSLAALNKQFLAILQSAADHENQARSTKDGKITVEPKSIGVRPAGSTRPDAALVRNTQAAASALGFTPDLAAASTDANLPISLGIPAVTIGSGGISGRAHSLDEWTDVAKPEGLRGMQVGLLALLATADMQPH